MRIFLTALFMTLTTHAFATDDLQGCIFDASMEVEIAKNDGDILKASKALIKGGYLNWLTVFEQANRSIIKDHNAAVNPELNPSYKFFPNEPVISDPRDALDVIKRRYAHLIGLTIFEGTDPRRFNFFSDDYAALNKTVQNEGLDVALYQCFLAGINSDYDPFNQTNTQTIELIKSVNFNQTKYGDLIFKQANQCWDRGSRRGEKVALKLGISLRKDGKIRHETVTLIDSVGGNSNDANFAFQHARRALMRCEKAGFGFPIEDYSSWQYVVTIFDPQAAK